MSPHSADSLSPAQAAKKKGRRKAGRRSASPPPLPDMALEGSVDGLVAGVDEAGRAPLAGPVVAAAVVLPPTAFGDPRLEGLTDSKLLALAHRERLYKAVLDLGLVSVGAASVAEIDRLNVLEASLLAMKRAVTGLRADLSLVLIDGNRAPDLGWPVETVVGGDGKSLSIAAASVVAKVTRDRAMARLARRYPGYGWATNVGYGADEHYMGLLRHGSTVHHRRSFGPFQSLFPVDGLGLTFPEAWEVRVANTRLVTLRRDLHVLCDGDAFLGVVKYQPGRGGPGHWLFKAVGFDGDGAIAQQVGPLAACHGLKLAGPTLRSVRKMLRAVRGEQGGG